VQHREHYIRAIFKAHKVTSDGLPQYKLIFEDGEPIFMLSEADRILEGVFEGMFDRGDVE
jgi:hypothetical protein